MASNNFLFQFDFFVSYSSADKIEVYNLCDLLKRRGFKIWIDKEQMILGNTDELMQQGIDQSQLFLCCATSSYCKSEFCMLEFKYAANIKKKIVYILFERFNGNEDRMEKLHKIAFRFAGEKYYKHEDIDGIVGALKNLGLNKTVEDLSLAANAILNLTESKNQPSKINNELIESKKVKIDIAGIMLRRMALFNKETNILITDYNKGLIHIFDLDGLLLNSINPADSLKRPFGISIGSKKNGDEEIFIYDETVQTVFLFNCYFKLIKRIGRNLIGIRYIMIDSKRDILYFSHTEDDVVTLWNVNDGQLTQKIKVKRPLNVKVKVTKILIVSDNASDCGYARGNSINVYNRLTLESIHIIKFDDWCWPDSLHLSSDIYTTAHVLDKNGIVSENRFLFAIDSENYQIKQKMELKDIGFLSDGLYLNNKLILCGVQGIGNELRIIEFDFMKV